MKKNFLAVSMLIVFFASCSQNSNVTYTGIDADTLKKVVQNKEDAAIWTRELESVRLTKNIRQIDSVADSIRLDADVVKVTAIQGEKIYPVIKDFGSLDVSEIPVNIYQSSKNFADSLSADLYSVLSFFNPSSLFSYVFFLEDLKVKFFDGALPQKPVKNVEAGDDEINSSVDDFYVFDKYIIGKSFMSGSEYQVPIRFYMRSNYLDVFIYISEENNKVSQIKIVSTSKNPA